MRTSDPGYLVLADRLAETLGGAEPGRRLPSEHDLAGTEGVSRVTARAALQELERRHLVRRTQGAGTFVSARIPYPIRDGADPSWTRTVQAAGREATYVEMEVTSERADASLARSLAIPRGRRVTRVTRIGAVDGERAARQTTWIPNELAPDIGMVLAETPSLTGALRDHYGYEPERWWSRAELSTASRRAADDLQLIGRPPAWRIDSANRCRRLDRPLHVGRAWLRADAFQVFLALGPIDGPLPTLEDE